MFFIAKGNSYVSIRESQKKEYKNFKKLKPGQHFGVRVAFSKNV